MIIWEILHNKVKELKHQNQFLLSKINKVETIEASNPQIEFNTLDQQLEKMKITLKEKKQIGISRKRFGR